ncbi:hypothetical protein JX265_012970 [Neoarthrinium moseri]|uniref:Carboxylic ester hydrolase n=1 Tax=Neoarthrinium moseri TaxID=1658444 RepID=A0A9P9W9C8_9PEZI|nr:uncharacterized protein JN550_002881 [Neoarthrinium moseri]KAI1852942.1 hypothetical protein JX265_012970 [Neoarthrinium moseri]KAI1874302.1 hypothetical protein JN550_002881 [Neoarthrinium moseri]
MIMAHLSMRGLSVTIILSIWTHGPSAVLGCSPQIDLDFGTFRGTAELTGVDSYLGIPFAHAGRFENPILVSPEKKLSGIQDATTYGPACAQGSVVVPDQSLAPLGDILQTVAALGPPGTLVESEDCLSINVQVPSGVSPDAKLPVVFWIHGGGWVSGSSGGVTNTTALADAQWQGARLSLFGFLASQEITDAGVSNLGQKDQRAAMQWVQKYIDKFGGDPSKVTLFGESAGALSIGAHLVLNDGDNEGLFRAAIMLSGGVHKWKDYRSVQPIFETVVSQVGCADAVDKVNCLRHSKYEDLLGLAKTLPGLVSYLGTYFPFSPRPDGVFLKDSPHRLLREGRYSRVPYLIGDTKDEGTIFSVIPQLNVTTSKDFDNYFELLFQNLTPQQVAAFTSLYSEDPKDGSPFDTGNRTFLGPQYKRLSAALGDITFQSTRRDLLNLTYNTQKAYTCQIEQPVVRFGDLPIGNFSALEVLGSFHYSDVALNAFGHIPPTASNNSLNLMSTIVAFTNSLNPNSHGLDLPAWPAWDPLSKAIFQFSEVDNTVITDDFREKQMGFLNENADIYTF